MQVINIKDYTKVTDLKGNLLTPVQALDFKHPGNWFYIGREMPQYGLEGSLLANPIKLKGEKSRNHSIRQYSQLLWDAIRNQHPLNGCMGKSMIDVLTIAANHRFLVCWCSPKNCHGDIVVKAIEWARVEGLITEIRL